MLSLCVIAMEMPFFTLGIDVVTCKEQSVLNLSTRVCVYVSLLWRCPFSEALGDHSHLG